MPFRLGRRLAGNQPRRRRPGIGRNVVFCHGRSFTAGNGAANGHDDQGVPEIPRIHDPVKSAAKGRACRYEVVGELGGDVTKDTVQSKPVNDDYKPRPKPKPESKKVAQTEEPVFYNAEGRKYTAEGIVKYSLFACMPILFGDREAFKGRRCRIQRKYLWKYWIGSSRLIL